MKIRMRYGNKFIFVEVSRSECRKFECLAPHKYQHGSNYKVSMKSTDADKHYSCANRNYHGCPDNPKLKIRRGNEMYKK